MRSLGTRIKNEIYITTRYCEERVRGSARSTCNITTLTVMVAVPRTMLLTNPCLAVPPELVPSQSRTTEIETRHRPLYLVRGYVSLLERLITTICMCYSWALCGTWLLRYANSILFFLSKNLPRFNWSRSLTASNVKEKHIKTLSP